MKYISFYGNLYHCPYGRRLTTCHVYPITHSSFEEKFYWFEGLTPAEKESVVKHHEQCARKRLKKINH